MDCKSLRWYLNVNSVLMIIQTNLCPFLFQLYNSICFYLTTVLRKQLLIHLNHAEEEFTHGAIKNIGEQTLPDPWGHSLSALYCVTVEPFNTLLMKIYTLQHSDGCHIIGLLGIVYRRQHRTCKIVKLTSWTVFSKP